ncbi:MAG: 4'-phosphopantetheinyl transferase superfamily protein [Bacteroidetes bacterium]|nr:4'-phosphopantetheinyl transferase superfamily protein [Bacteroidota bacterium]
MSTIPGNCETTFSQQRTTIYFFRFRFFTLWTRKEAILKAMGTGLQSRIDDIDTTQNCILKNGCLYEVKSLQVDGQVISYSMDQEHFEIPICISI